MASSCASEMPVRSRNANQRGSVYSGAKGGYGLVQAAGTQVVPTQIGVTDGIHRVSHHDVFYERNGLIQTAQISSFAGLAIDLGRYVAAPQK